MAKRRLQQWMRSQLKAHAEKVIEPAAEKEALAGAYKKAAPLVLKMVHAKFPPRDMKICKKYGAASVDDCIKTQFPDGNVKVFDFNTGSGPVVTSKTYHGQMYLADKPTAEAIDAWCDASAAFKAERKKRLAAYGALIDGASYLDDVIEVWPEASDVVPSGALPIPLGPEQIKIVKADQIERKAA